MNFRDSDKHLWIGPAQCSLVWLYIVNCQRYKLGLLSHNSLQHGVHELLRTRSTRNILLRGEKYDGALVFIWIYKSIYTFLNDALAYGTTHE